MIVIVARFETDGDYRVDNKATGLSSPPDDEYCHGGVFLCTDTDEAEALLERLFNGVDADGYMWQKFVQIFAEAQCALEDPEAIRFGWLRLLNGNYEGTLLFMQEVADERGEPVIPETIVDERGYTWLMCPYCGHPVTGMIDDKSGPGGISRYHECFDYCPGCGQRIDWGGEK